MNNREKLLELPEGGLLAPSVIYSVTPFPNKGVGLFNEHQQMVGFVPAKPSDKQRRVIDVFKEIVNSGNKRWVQPDWTAVLGDNETSLAVVTKSPAPVSQPNKTDSKVA